MGYQFQKGLERKAYAMMLEKDWVVLAGACASGKTNMGINITHRYLKEYPGQKVLILAHGQIQLRNQFTDRIESLIASGKLKKFPSYGEIQGKARLQHDVNIALPQSFNHRKVGTKIGLLIVDEAHHFYHAEMVQDIIKMCRPDHQLLLTGTPSPFIKKKQQPIVSVSSGELLKHGVLSNPVIEIVQSAYDYGVSNYNHRGDLTASFVEVTKKTNETLDMVLRALHKKLTSTTRINYHAKKRLPEEISREFKKTLIACRSQKQALDVYNYFTNRGVHCALSTSDHDVESIKIDEFVNEKSCRILIVVFRGVLGFNYEDLANVIDLTGSKNPDRIFQLLSRGVRKSKLEKTKLFVKVTSKEMYRLTYATMCCTVALSYKQFYESYDGNYSNSTLMVSKKFIEDLEENESEDDQQSDSEGDGDKKESGPSSRPHLSKWPLPDIKVFIELKKNEKKILSEYAYTTFSDVEKLIYRNNRKQARFWTFARCKQEALKFKTRSEWYKKGNQSYGAARKNGWLDKCSQHMVSLKKANGYWTFERCLADAKKYLTRNEWCKKSASGYGTAQKRGWLIECSRHMKRPMKPQGYWTLERCKKDAEKYLTKNQWRKKSGAAYSKASYSGWMDACSRHMLKIRKIWTLEKCKKDAEKFHSRSEWRKKSPNGYASAQWNDWVTECCHHMNRLVNPNGYWTLFRCKIEAKKYRTKSEWSKKSGSSYNKAKQMGWSDECCRHMEVTRKPSRYWGFERCKMEAKKYRTRKEWAIKAASSYSKAQQMKWLDLCCRHMKSIHKPNGYWTLERCKMDAKKYRTRKEWYKKSSSGYAKAQKMKWLNLCCRHMKKKKK